MIDWIFNWIYVSSNERLFIYCLIFLLLIILITIYLVVKELKNKNVNK